MFPSYYLQLVVVLYYYYYCVGCWCSTGGPYGASLVPLNRPDLSFLSSQGGVFIIWRFIWGYYLLFASFVFWRFFGLRKLAQAADTALVAWNRCCGLHPSLQWYRKLFPECQAFPRWCILCEQAARLLFLIAILLDCCSLRLFCWNDEDSSYSARQEDLVLNWHRKQITPDYAIFYTNIK